MVGFDLIRHVQGMPANFTRNQGLNAEQIRMTAQPSHAAHVVASVNVQCAVRSAIMFLVSEHGNAVQAKEALLPVRVCGLSLALNHATTPRLAGCRRNHEAAYRSPDSASALTMFDITTASLAPQHAYVLLTLLVSVFTVHMFMPLRVGKARKKYGVKYPALYADSGNKDANAFNCVQRGHQNTLEGYPLFLALLFASGVQGYSTGNPANRQKGAFFHLGELGFLTLIGMSAYNLLTLKNVKVAS